MGRHRHQSVHHAARDTCPHPARERLECCWYSARRMAMARGEPVTRASPRPPRGAIGCSLQHSAGRCCSHVRQWVPHCRAVRPHRRGPPDDDWVDVVEVLVTPAAGGGLTNGAFLGVRSAPTSSHSIFPVGKLWSACDVRILQICSSVLSAMLFLFVFPFPDKVISSICT